jgi:hypothetical protein
LNVSERVFRKTGCLHPKQVGYIVRCQVLTAASTKFSVFWDVLPCSQVDVDDVSEVRTACIIALTMEAVRTSETSINICLTTWQYIPEDSKLQIGYIVQLVRCKLNI